MGATLDALFRLQTIEDKLRSVRGQIDAKRRVVQAHQRRIARLEHDIADLHQAVRQAQADADRLELDRKSREEHTARLREVLNRTKTNKEYAAILTQLNTEKADATKLEDKVLAALAKVDEHRQREQELRAALTKEQNQTADLVRQAEQGEAKLVVELKELQAQRQEATSRIAPSVLAVFERACEKHEGEAMAQLDKVHPKRSEYICSGCNMSIPLEVINALQSRDEIQQCHTCSRILYLEHATAAV